MEILLVAAPTLQTARFFDVVISTLLHDRFFQFCYKASVHICKRHIAG